MLVKNNNKECIYIYIIKKTNNLKQWHLDFGVLW